MHAERTPNPNSIKWVLGRDVVEAGQTAAFESAPGEDVSPLATAVFEVEGVVGVFLAANFVTVSKRDDVEWTDIAQPIVDIMKRHLGSNQPALGPAFSPEAAPERGDVVDRICELLDREIRPSVAMDGGDISFASFRNGTVELHMRGACSGCPSSTATLKLAIESRLRAEIPEVIEVVAVS
jgi:Fe-S cluster biogenesis protein NfuA